MFGYFSQQIGMIVFGAGMNKAAWIADARNRGLLVVDYGPYATLHKIKTS